MRRPRPSPDHARARRPLRRSAAGVAALAVVLAGCGGGARASSPDGSAPGTGGTGPARAGRPGGTTTTLGRRRPLEVVVSAYPLAQLVTYLGGGNVGVVDLAGPGEPPQGLRLDAAQLRLVRSAPLVVDVGDGYQPQVEQAAGGARHHVALLPAVSPHQALPYQFWLDPSLMSAAATTLVGVLSKLDPTAAGHFANGGRDFQSVASSLSSDLQSNFSSCSRQVFVTQDDAFGRMAAAFGLTEVVAGQRGTAETVALVRQQSLPAVFAEVGNPSGVVDRVAAQAHVSVRTLDPLEVAPAPGTAALSYFAVMEEDLTNLEGPLACDTSGSFS